MSLLLLFNQPAGIVAADSLTLSGPSTAIVNVASAAFTVTLAPSGGTSAGVVVTPHGTLSGSFSPATLTLSTGTPSGTFTRTATAAGTDTISLTNDGALGDPAPLSLDVSEASAGLVIVTLGVGGMDLINTGLGGIA